MNANLKGFNAENVEPQSWDVLPPGDYEVAIIDSDMRPTKNGEGEYLELQMDVLDGKWKGRKLFDRLNLKNKNPKAVEIAKATLSSICRAVEVLTPNDSSDLHGRPLIAQVKVRNDPQYGESNEVKGYKKCDGEAARAKLPPRGQDAPDDEVPF